MSIAYTETVGLLIRVIAFITSIVKCSFLLAYDAFVISETEQKYIIYFGTKVHSRYKKFKIKLKC